MWYHKHIGGERCPIVDTWWQTETGQILITPLPGLTTTKPGSATRPSPASAPEIRNQQGEKVEVGGGLLALTKPWPAHAARHLRRSRALRASSTSAEWQDGVYFTGDGARRDADGYFWLLGRVDDVLNVAGHRIGTMEVESALVDHPSVAEAAVVGRHHEIKGQAIAAFVTLKAGQHGTLDLVDELREHVIEEDRRDRAARGRPLRRRPAEDALGQDHASAAARHRGGPALGDTTTLADPAVVAKLKENYQEEQG